MIIESHCIYNKFLCTFIYYGRTKSIDEEEVMKSIKTKKSQQKNTIIVGTNQKVNRKIVERDKIDTPKCGLTHIYATAHIPGLAQALQ